MSMGARTIRLLIAFNSIFAVVAFSAHGSAPRQLALEGLFATVTDADVDLTTNVKLTAVSRRSGLGFLRSSSRGQAHKYLVRLMKKYGENFIILGKYAILNDPAAIRDVLLTHNLPKAPEVMRGYESLFGGDSILAAPWKEWMAQRKMVGPALLAEQVMGELPAKFEEGSKGFFAFLDQAASDQELVEMDGAFTAVTLDIIGLVLLGRSFGMCDRLGVVESEQFVEALEVLTAEAVRKTGNPDLLISKTTKSKKGQKSKDRIRRLKRRVRRRRIVRNAKAVVNDFLEECIELKLVNKKPEENSRSTDLLDILLDAESKNLIGREDVKGQLLTFIFAGYDTTSHTLAWLLFEVAQNTALQEDLATEAREALPAWDDFPRNRDILACQLPLLERVFKETLRKHPAAANGTLRVVGERPIKVGNGFELPAHTRVLIPPYSLHRNERLWPNPEIFDPSRFEEGLSASRDPMSYQPFSGGPRNCIGSRLAAAEALSLLAPLLRRYSVSYVGDDDKEPADYCGLVRKPRDGLHFTFTRRN